MLPDPENGHYIKQMPFIFAVFQSSKKLAHTK